VSWYWWILIWLVVVMMAIGVLALIGLSLFRKAKALLTEATTAADRLGAVSQELQELAERTSDPAVFSSATQLRQEQILDARRRDGKPAARAGGPKAPSGRRSAQSQGQRVR